LELNVIGKNISKVDNCKYLGVMTDCKLSGQDDINYVYNKIMKFTSIFYFFLKYEKKINPKYITYLHLHLCTALAYWCRNYSSTSNGWPTL